MKLHGFPLSPFVRKVALVLAEKGLDFDWTPTNPRKPDAEFSTASPFHKIPALIDGDYSLADSSAIVAYLDLAYPSPAILPDEAKARGKAVFLEEVVDTILIPAGVPIMLNRFLKPVFLGKAGDEEAALAAEEAVKHPLSWLESQAATHEWLGEAFSVGDLAMCSVFRSLEYTGWSLDAAAYPALNALYDKVKVRPSWVAVAEREAAIFASLRG
jgi:glutathione S-transferase